MGCRLRAPVDRPITMWKRWFRILCTGTRDRRRWLHLFRYLQPHRPTMLLNQRRLLQHIRARSCRPCSTKYEPAKTHPAARNQTPALRPLRGNQRRLSGHHEIRNQNGQRLPSPDCPRSPECCPRCVGISAPDGSHYARRGGYLLGQLQSPRCAIVPSRASFPDRPRPPADEDRASTIV